jgi:hypothetical protein
VIYLDWREHLRQLDPKRWVSLYRYGALDLDWSVGVDLTSDPRRASPNRSPMSLSLGLLAIRCAPATRSSVHTLSGFLAPFYASFASSPSPFASSRLLTLSVFYHHRLPLSESLLTSREQKKPRTLSSPLYPAPPAKPRARPRN